MFSFKYILFLGRRGFIWFQLKSHCLSVRGTTLPVRPHPSEPRFDTEDLWARKTPRRIADLSAMKPVNICPCCTCVSVSWTIRADKHAHSLTPAVQGGGETVVCVFVENVNASHEELMSRRRRRRPRWKGIWFGKHFSSPVLLAVI